MIYCLVPKDELKDLLYDSLRLQALDCGGVDNWDWYGASIRDFIDAAKADYNVPEDDDDFDISDMADVDVEGYRTVEE
jgi:hypothetical protein